MSSRSSLPVRIARGEWFAGPLGFAVLAGLLLRLVILTNSPATLFEHGYLIDDSYYLFAEARELADGRPFHVSPFEPGNGVQPLIYIAAAPFFAVFENTDSAIVCVLVLSSLLSLGTAILLARWASRLGAGKTAWVAGALWALSPAVLEHELNGLETSLNLFALAALGCWWPRMALRPFILGTMLGICYLARVDNILLAPAVGLILATQRPWRTSGSGDSRTIARYCLRGAAGLIWVIAPYTAASIHWTGRFFPQSGRAITWITTLPAPRDAGLIHEPAMIGYQLQAAAATLWQKIQVHLLGTEWRPEWINWWWIERPVGLVAGIAYLVLLLALAVRIRTADLKGISRFWPAVVLIAAWVAVYSIAVGGYWYFSRYFQPFLLLLSLFGAWIFRRHAPQSARGGAIALAMVVLFAVQSASLVLFQLRREPQPTVLSAYEGLAAARFLLEDDENAAAMQSGYLGFETRGRIRNLDGVVSDRALRARKSGRMGEYLREERVRLLIEWPAMCAQFLEKTVPNGGIRVTEVERLPYRLREELKLDPRIYQIHRLEYDASFPPDDPAGL